MTLREKLTQKSETSKKLSSLLADIWNDDDFVIGILGTLKTDEQKQKMIDILEDGETDIAQINLISLDIIDGEI